MKNVIFGTNIVTVAQPAGTMVSFVEFRSLERQEQAVKGARRLNLIPSIFERAPAPAGAIRWVEV